MSTEHPDWGRRLSDALRAAIGRNDLAAALALAREGDGQARSLASEFLLMSRGLGITVRVLLGQLGGLTEGLTPSSGTVPDSQALERDLRRLLADFRGSLEGSQEGSRGSVLGDGLAGGQAGDRGGESLPEVAQFTLRVLQARQQRFESDQALAAQQVIDALLAHDAARASQWLERKEIHDYLPYHDRLVRFMADSFGFVLERFGDQGLLRFHLDTAEGQRAGFEKWEKQSAAEFARTSAFLLKQHMGQVAVTEDDEKFTIVQTPCGSGGRLQTEGAYRGAHPLPFVSTPGPLTLGAPRIPVYCSHCPAWNGVATMRWFGRAHWIFDHPARADGSCTLHVYKRAEDVPAEFNARLAPA
ncbi:MAG: hypothetical protein KA778_08410 [Burkholderiaceae bacterium]|nr:hypothetical protein [Burkholderiaceae bacterium]MBP7660013.1 hypothetical protein [Burkholderiaceae bacterium]